MLRIRALLPLIGYSPIQLLPLAYATSELCAMSLGTRHRARFALSIIRIEFFESPFWSLRSPNKRVDTFPAKTPASTTFMRCHSERSGRVQFPRTAFRSARPRSRSAYFAADAFQRIPHKVCTPQNRHCENPSSRKNPSAEEPDTSNMLVAEELEPELWEVRGPSYPGYLDATTVTFSAYCIS
jgi:hypothetical protein